MFIEAFHFINYCEHSITMLYAQAKLLVPLLLVVIYTIKASHNGLVRELIHYLQEVPKHPCKKGHAKTSNPDLINMSKLVPGMKFSNH